LPLLLPPTWRGAKSLAGDWSDWHFHLLIAIGTPLFIWILEIIEGHCLMGLFGYCRAWQYCGKDAWFNGTIKLSYYPHWFAIGLVCSVFFDDLFDQMIV
jgi:hypothetical protein